MSLLTPEFYPCADRSAQWFEDNWPGDRMDVNTLVIHTTETSGWPSYDGGAKAPNLTAIPDRDVHRLRWRQHFRINTSSRALRNLAGGVETNTLNVVQVELVGTCDPSYKGGGPAMFWPAAPAWALDELAAFVRWCRETQGIPLRAPSVWLPYPDSYGLTPSRMTGAEWLAFSGVCGHQHVPENVHGDPGKLNIKYLLDKAGEDMPLTDDEITKIARRVLTIDGLITNVGVDPVTNPEAAKLTLAGAISNIEAQQDEDRVLLRAIADKLGVDVPPF